MKEEEEYERAIEIYNYNPLTGDLVYIQNTRKNKIGNIAGYNDVFGYVRVNANVGIGKYRNFKAHRLAFYIMEGELPEQVDHIDGDPSNNKWFNLRGCTQSENGMNRGINSRNTSGYRGVSKSRGKWRGRVYSDGKGHEKNGFATAKLANTWVIAKSKEVYGEFYNENR